MKKTYYDIVDDLSEHPECWLLIVVGGRGTGKTYGTLKHYLEEDKPIVFVKRTNKDVDMICAGQKIGSKLGKADLDLSPYKPICRDFGFKVSPVRVEDGIGAFYKLDEENQVTGSPIAYIVSLNAVGKVKGFDMSECVAIVFDEFIPLPYERISTKEGEQLLDLYKTVDRDRTLRGCPELKLICLSNATNVYNPTCDLLGLTDTITNMAVNRIHSQVDPERGIFIRMIETSDDMMSAEATKGIYRAMANTDWGRMSFGNEFAYNDFSAIGKTPLKEYKLIAKYLYRDTPVYIYKKGQDFYISSIPSDRNAKDYNLNHELEQRRFYYDLVMEIQQRAVAGHVVFEKYSYYDLLINYKKRFTIN